MDRIENFEKELKQLLKKYNAGIFIEDFGSPWSIDSKILVDFNWNIDREKESTPKLILGTYIYG